ncbi:MAG TPA: DUF1292 domain-containing protein [bacterium]|nr:DUF1292 domain-containing protein [bacterium]
MTSRGETITMLDDEGLPHDFTLVDVVEVDDQRYAVLQPDDPAAGAVLFRVEGETMTPVEDDDEFDRVVDALRDLEEYDDLIIEDGTDEDAGEEGDDKDDDEEDDGP